MHLIFFFISVYATTAANPYESSYACYFDKKRQTYLGDVYSVKWMENSDAVCIHVKGGTTCHYTLEPLPTGESRRKESLVTFIYWL